MSRFLSVLPMIAAWLLAAALGCGRSEEHATCARPSTANRPALTMPVKDSDPLPTLLSQTGAFSEVRTLTPNAKLIPYEVNVPFWSDGSTKSRWIALPESDAAPPKIEFSPTGEWKLPQGTVLVKHFEIAADAVYPERKRRLETRLLVCDAPGHVYGASYRWRSDESDADLVVDAATDPIHMADRDGERTLNWWYPGQQDCKTCHTCVNFGVLGVNARQLNRDIAIDGKARNQLLAWSDRGMFDRKLTKSDLAACNALPAPADASRSLEDRARSMLDVNCSFCHRPGGAAADFDARFDTPLAKQNLLEAPARINFGIDKARFIASNDPWRSMVVLRMTTLEPIKMPPVGHSTVDQEAVALLHQWIRTLPGLAALPPPSIEPKGGDHASEVHVRLTHTDSDAAIRYTLDGSVPNASSPRYTEPIVLQESATLRARAFRDGFTRSIPVHETFLISK